MEIKTQKNQLNSSSLAHLLQADKENSSLKYPDDQGGGHHRIFSSSGNKSNEQMISII